MSGSGLRGGAVFSEPGEEERLVRESVADVVASLATADALARQRHEGSSWDPALFRTAAELGWLGLLVPAADGGAGLGLRAAAAAWEELGRAPVMGPLLTSAAIATAIVAEAGPSPLRDGLLAGLVAGERILALAAMDGSRGWGPSLVTTAAEAIAGPASGGVRLRGVKALVVDAATATDLLVAARDEDARSDGRHGSDGVSLFVVPVGTPGVRMAPVPGLAPGLARVTLDGVAVPADARLDGGWAALERGVLRALPVVSAWAVGACQAIFDFTLEYTRVRWAFGQPIGRFQRVQDHVVELANQLDGARWMTAELVARLAAGEAHPADVHEAAAVAISAYYQAVNCSHMVHAGPGTDLDHPLMGHTIASRVLYPLLGTPDHHKRRMMDLRFPIG